MNAEVNKEFLDFLVEVIYESKDRKRVTYVINEIICDEQNNLITFRWYVNSNTENINGSNIRFNVNTMLFEYTNSFSNDLNFDLNDILKRKILELKFILI